MSTETMAKRWSSVMMDNYGLPPIALMAGQGSRVIDADGAEYLDFIAGIAVSSLGHRHPAVVEAVSRQVNTLTHTSNLFLHEPGLALAERLVELVDQPGARVYFTNDGTEANECALKIARLHGGKSGRSTVVSTDNSFHGRTLGSLSITGNPAKRLPFEPLPGPVTFVPYGDVEALARVVDRSVSAVFLEPTQGEGGIVPAPPGYLAAARRICDEAGALLVIDEVQSGIGRTGRWFASLGPDRDSVRPDLLTLAKGLGGGLPIGACIGFGEAGELLTPGSHGSTFGGNPVSCAAALAVLDTIAEQNLLEHVRVVGARLFAGLAAIDDPLIAEIRGSGLWLGVVLVEDRAGAVEKAAAARGLLVNAVKPSVVRLAPPLIVTPIEVDDALAILTEAVHEVSRAGSK
ncbi:acetylornithine transaminase [Jatrophihabitans telluris]|uniref:Acetylornithine aminotransferase n=1 Tax=Jatrophihabitans telluris TaxID=2038343 RepID=A0ABY4R2R8_9ACTN|nr:acetylornithine transaminase [Jatrophihabitans telluris]UQX90104.1 acetylornithine transaminase [Jatrophihabitans telluris]